MNTRFGLIFVALCCLVLAMCAISESFFPALFELSAKKGASITIILPDGYTWDSSVSSVVINENTYSVGYSHKDTRVFIPGLPSLSDDAVIGLNVSGPQFPIIATIDNGKTKKDIEIKAEVQ